LWYYLDTAGLAGGLENGGKYAFKDVINAGFLAAGVVVRAESNRIVRGSSLLRILEDQSSFRRTYAGVDVRLFFGLRFSVGISSDVG
jgi:hypothetical protein